MASRAAGELQVADVGRLNGAGLGAAGMPYLVHVDLRDLHGQMACPRPSTVRLRPIGHISHKTG
jgi:hypothetical protein